MREAGRLVDCVTLLRRRKRKVIASISKLKNINDVLKEMRLSLLKILLNVQFA